MDVEILSFYGDNFNCFFNIAFDIISNLTQSTIFGSPNDDLAQIFLLNHVLPIFKMCLYKAWKNEIFNLNTLKKDNKNLGDLETNSKVFAGVHKNDKYGKKRTIINKT